MEENNPNLRKKKNNNYFYLIAFLISVVAIGLTWTSLANKKVGITDILPCIHKTASETLKDQGLSIFAFAFFLHAILQSQAFQALFASKRKWLEKRKYFTIGLITIGVALLSSSLSWFDEFVHFYPLVIPLFLAMGFDFFSSFLCLYGGSIAGLLGLVSSERMKSYFGQAFGDSAGNINYNGLAGFGFRITSFVIFTTIIILFNIWYSSRNSHTSSKNKGDKLMKEETPPSFNKANKIILAVAGFFLFVSILGQFTPIAKKIEKSKITEKISDWISSEYDKKEKDKYQEIGKIGKMKIAKVKEENKESYWGTFGDWGGRAIDCWLIIGAIIICLVAKQSIIKTLITAIQSSIPLLMIYIFAAVPADIIGNSGISDNLAKKILPASVAPSAGYLALLSIFGLSILFSFFIASTAMTSSLVKVSAPALLAISAPTLIYAAIFSWVGGILGMAFSPNNGILMASLEKSKISFKQFIKKTWKLWSTILITAFGLVSYWAKFKIN